MPAARATCAASAPAPPRPSSAAGIGQAAIGMPWGCCCQSNCHATGLRLAPQTCGAGRPTRHQASSPNAMPILSSAVPASSSNTRSISVWNSLQVKRSQRQRLGQPAGVSAGLVPSQLPGSRCSSSRVPKTPPTAAITSSSCGRSGGSGSMRASSCNRSCGSGSTGASRASCARGDYPPAVHQECKFPLVPFDVQASGALRPAHEAAWAAAHMARHVGVRASQRVRGWQVVGTQHPAGSARRVSAPGGAGCGWCCMLQRRRARAGVAGPAPGAAAT